MTNALGTAYDDTFLDSLLGVDQMPGVYPSQSWAALWIVTPDRDGTGGTEVADGDGYERVRWHSNSATYWDAAAGGVKASAKVLTFPTALAPWGTIQAISIMSSEDYGDGEMFLLAELVVPKSITTGAAIFFPAADLRFVIP